MITRYRRRSLAEFIATGNLWLLAWLIVVIAMATYGLLDKFA
jgi:hypothetical protein